MKCISLLKRLWRRRDGAAAIEFAIVSIPFFMLFMGLIEFGLYMTTEVALESAVTQSARIGAICSPNGSATPGGCVAKVEASVRKYASGIPNASQIFFTENTVVAAGAGAGTGGAVEPDICFPNGVNNPPDASATTCSCANCVFFNNDGQAGFQPASANNAGNSGDLVEIRATYPWHVMFPIFGQFFGTNGVVMISTSTVVRNE